MEPGIHISWASAMVLIVSMGMFLGWINRRSAKQIDFDKYKIDLQTELNNRFKNMEDEMNDIVKKTDLQIHNIRLEVNSIVTKLDFFSQTIHNLSNKIEDQTETIKQMEGYKEGYRNGKKNYKR